VALEVIQNELQLLSRTLRQISQLRRSYGFYEKTRLFRLGKLCGRPLGG